ncbi:MAG: ATP-binding cassette domain-containing protein [Elusimicrobiota bacterium]
MLKVENLSRNFGQVKALDNVSFEVNRGEILGLLGPNGAGKTTMMRIITCFLPAGAGTVKVDGLDVFEDSMKVREKIGYLPENLPIYNDLSVQSYLNYVAEIRGIEKSRRPQAVEKAMEMVNVADKRNRLIGHLSRGYKQRVGLAQAIIHNPPLLILDEPTIGLDPKQIIEIRRLIKSLKGEHTIILSSHILPEVSMTCDRVVIIDEGKIVAIDTQEELTHQVKGAEKIFVNLKTNGDPSVEEKVAALSGVEKVEGEYKESFCSLTIGCQAHQEIREALFRMAVTNNWVIYELRPIRVSLEEIFLRLTTEEQGVN